MILVSVTIKLAKMGKLTFISGKNNLLKPVLAEIVQLNGLLNCSIISL